MKRRRWRRDLITYALIFVIGALISFYVFPGPTPVPPAPVVGPDTGWHEALAEDGRDYVIDLRYDAMNDAQRDDANRFAREFPSGH